MKREQFSILSTEGLPVTKSTWNAAIRETERLIREIAQRENAFYELTGKSGMKINFSYVWGSRQWTRADGHVVVFSITKLPS